MGENLLLLLLFSLPLSTFGRRHSLGKKGEKEKGERGKGEKKNQVPSVGITPANLISGAKVLQDMKEKKGKKKR